MDPSLQVAVHNKDDLKALFIVNRLHSKKKPL
jgi:hypothetical protein